jgi:hypothetical protein
MNPMILQVGPQRNIKTIAACASIARAGAIILVDSGDYLADVAAWQQDDITIRAVGGRVRLLAQGAAAEGKGIWVVRANRMQVEGFDFEGAAVPSRNGADGTASYELEFPNGGMAFVVGNTIAQSTLTENPCLISFGAEGYKWPRYGAARNDGAISSLRA